MNVLIMIKSLNINSVVQTVNENPRDPENQSKLIEAMAH